MAATPISMSELSVPTPMVKDGFVRTAASSGKKQFSQHLNQAMEARNIVPSPMLAERSSARTRVNPFVEAVMVALKHAKEMRTMPLTPDMANVDSAGLRTNNWPSTAAAVLDTSYSGSGIVPGRPIKPQVSAQDITPKTWAGNGGGKYEGIIQKASKAYGVDADLIRSVIKVESSFNPKAVSPSGAMGMMQLMPATAKDLGVKNPFDAEQNIMGGTAYLSRLLDRYDGNVRSALAAYNWGMGNLEKKPVAAMPGETRQYVSRIMGMMEGDAPA